MPLHGALPSRYLSIQEPASRFWKLFLTALFETKLQGPHEMSTICGQFISAGNSQERSFSFFLIMNEKTSYLLFSVLCVETQSHPPHGANVIVSDSIHMAEFCKSVLGLQGYS